MLLSTSRLILRHFRPDDAEILSAYRSDPDVARYQSWDAPVPLDRARSLIAIYAAGDPRVPGWFQYAVERDGVLIGDVGVKLHDTRMQADIGYTLAAAHQGQGYATEAVRRVIEDLFEHGVRRVSAECDARNLRSARLLERLGFRREGLRRAKMWFKGEWTDDLVYGLLREEWRSTPQAAEPG
ncbi:GNAT family protein [Sphaerisporangium sp. NPDC051011]|uniref:GNAT family N-acetyltransferase n=1 Tax=Sphaerisporangium sp. NPDC051011 TaxID=3155792 RepID=UPI003404A2EF